MKLDSSTGKRQDGEKSLLNVRKVVNLKKYEISD